MKVACKNCSKAFELPDDRLPAGKKISFPCPGCKSKITLDLREKPDPIPEQPDATSDGSKEKVVFSPLAEKPSGKLEGSDLKRKILNRIKDLPPMPKIIYKAREVMANPMSGFKEIAEVVGASPNTVKSRMRYALERLRQLLGDLKEPHEL